MHDKSSKLLIQYQCIAGNVINLCIIFLYTGVSVDSNPYEDISMSSMKRRHMPIHSSSKETTSDKETTPKHSEADPTYAPIDKNRPKPPTTLPPPLAQSSDAESKSHGNLTKLTAQSDDCTYAVSNNYIISTKQTFTMHSITVKFFLFCICLYSQNLIKCNMMIRFAFLTLAF